MREGNGRRGVEGYGEIAHLHDDGQAGTQRLELEGGDIGTVNGERARGGTVCAVGRLDEAPQRRDKGRLAGACAADHPYLGARLDDAAHVLESEVELRPVAHAHVVGDDTSCRRPRRLRHRTAAGWLRLDVARVLEDTLDGGHPLLELELRRERHDGTGGLVSSVVNKQESRCGVERRAT